MPSIKNHFGLEPGDWLEVNGHCIQILEEAARGGLGVVYRARFEDGSHSIAVKQFQYPKFYNPSDGSNDCEHYWEREARICQLQCCSQEPNMRFFGAVKLTQYTDPEYYLFLEYIYGEPLNQWYRQKFHSVDTIALTDMILFLDIIMQIARHMFFVHRDVGVIHRDLTVKNIMLIDQNSRLVPIVIDWGVAKEVDRNCIFNPPKPFFHESRATSTAFFNRGSAPEVVGGFEPYAATDIYMLGHILFYLLTGGLHLRTPKTSSDYILHPRDYNPNVPLALDEIVANMTQFEPADRIKDMYVLWEICSQAKNSLETLLAGDKTQAASAIQDNQTEISHFLSRLNSLGKDLFQYLEDYEKYAGQYQKTPHAQINSLLKGFQEHLVNLSNTFDNLWKSKKARGLLDPTFLAEKIENIAQFAQNLEYSKENFLKLKEKIEHIYSQQIMLASEEFLHQIDSKTREMISWIGDIEELLELKQNSQASKANLKQIKQEILNLTSQLEKMMQLKYYKNLLVGYYLEMKKNEFQIINDKIKVCQADFQQYLNQNQATSPKSHESSDSFKSKKKDGYFGRLLTTFLAINLDFHCSNCHQKIYFGDPYCESCNGDIAWDYNKNAVMKKLALLSSKGLLKCPNDNCGAKIALDWKNCAYCGLSIEELLNAKPSFG